MYTSQVDNDFVQSIKKGLGGISQKRVDSKYFYDSEGSRLFEELCRQPEYYPWRIEAALLRQHSKELVRMFDDYISLVELGSGSSVKTRILLHELLLSQPNVYYFPVDVSKEMLYKTTRELHSKFSNLRVIGLTSEYTDGIKKANELIFSNPQIPNRKLIIFLGSSIGNFEPADSIAFLRHLRSKMDEKDNLVIGMDLRKDKMILEAAYNDSNGTTARFNLNILSRINRELDGNFNNSFFTHNAFYNSVYERIEMHLTSTKEQQVYLGRINEAFGFRRGETIHTENSYKYSLEEIRRMAEESQFSLKTNFVDERGWFSLAVFSPAS